MKANCPGCKVLREEVARPGADMGELLMQAALREAPPQCQDNKHRGPRDTKSHRRRS